MIISLALLLLVTASGTLATYAYDEVGNFPARLCTGACTGIAALGLIGFIVASFLGLTPLAILLTLVVLAAPLVLLKNSHRRVVVQQDVIKAWRRVRDCISNPSRIPLGYTIFYAIVAVILWRVFQRAMIDLPEGIYTGVLNNFGDLPFHISVITSFAYGNNFLPEDPTYAGVRFTYPFLTDFVSAIFLRCGADLRQSMFIENFVLALAFVGVLHRWALELLRDRLAALLTPVLVFLNGGFGWVLLWPAMQKYNSTAELLKALPVSFTIIPETTWRWGNAVSALLIPQRGFLLGLPLAVIVFTQWWLATEDAETRGQGDAGNKNKSEKSKQKTKKLGAAKQSGHLPVSLSPRLRVSPIARMIAAGIIAGLLPLVHAHSFVVVMVVGACIALLQQRWRDWTTFFIVASLIALPQMWWSTHNSAVNSSAFFAYEFGWDSAKEIFFNFKLGSQTLQTMPRLRTTLERLPDVVWFWLKNAGLFLPLTIAALLWRGEKKRLVSRRLLLFLAPFSLCFIVPNVLKMAPWIWDNIKVLFYWWVASAPLVAILLARLWQKGFAQRFLALVLFACITLAGALDVGAIVMQSAKFQVFDSAGVAFAELVKEKTEPRALIIHAPVHNHPVFLTGRRSLMGYPGHIWTHGLDYTQREAEIKRIYAGGSDAPLLLQKYGVQYAVVGPHERDLMTVNDRFFSGFHLIGEVGGYRLYKITQP
ncbi:MAG TPA: hypothetical protein VN951_15960 [Pyrinomonadaceae bacterium]|nr:hypothetical protein [Pyrinomonadaceae bacterium]